MVYLFYQLFLRRLTFYNWNRLYLLGYTLLSFLIPLVDIMPSLQKRAPDSVSVLQWIPVISLAQPEQQRFFAAWTYWDWSMIIVTLGASLMLIRFLIRLISFKRMKAKARLISAGTTNIYQLDEDIRPFSFGNAIFINTEMHLGEELEEIIRHEFVHVKQQHTIDILWCELICILNWFNPFVWALRHNVKQNLEFIADHQVLQNGIDKKEYQYLLLKVMGNPQFAFTNHFNLSSLKKRIIMMNTLKTARIHLVKFMFFLPVVAVLLLSFRKEVIKQQLAERVITTQQQSPVTAEEKPILPKVKTAEPTAVTIVKKDTVPVKAENILVSIRGNFKSDPPPLIVLDGVEMEGEAELNAINPNTIESISVLRGENAGSLYGEKARNGVLIITTKTSATDYKKPEGKNSRIVLEGKQVETSATMSGTGEVVIVTDNPTILPRENNVQSGTNDTRVKPASKIASDEIVVTGYRMENAEARDKIPLKGRTVGVAIRPANEEVVVTGYPSNKTKMISGLPENTYYVLNGEKVKRKAIEKLKPGAIKSINVLKGANAIAFYGEKAKAGAVVISTR